MKNCILIIVLGLIFSACRPAYVSVRPTNSVVERPIRPSVNHVWVDGDWVYNRRSHVYSRNESYWVKPNRGKKYTQGKWKSTQKGDYWVRGRWR